MNASDTPAMTRTGRGLFSATPWHRSTSITFTRQAFTYRMSVFSQRRAKNGVFDATVTKP
jgi:hypothetical protein